MTDQTQATASTESESRKAKAKHELLSFDDENGAKRAAPLTVEDEEKADGIRYTDLESGNVFDYYIDTDTSSALMLAIFGAKTLATNEASRVRQSDGDGAAQIAGIKKRFALIDTGVWAERAPKGPITYDRDVLAEAMVDVFVASGAIAESDRAATLAQAQALVSTDEGQKAALDTAGVKEAYSVRQGKKQPKSAADLLAMLQPKA